jgi:hypothetical protein
MSSITASPWRSFLFIIAALAAVTASIDLLAKEWSQFGSSLCVLIGVLAFERSLRFHSVRWRTVAWIAFVMAAVMQAMRFALG